MARLGAGTGVLMATRVKNQIGVEQAAIGAGSTGGTGKKANFAICITKTAIILMAASAKNNGSGEHSSIMIKPLNSSGLIYAGIGNIPFGIILHFGPTAGLHCLAQPPSPIIIL